MMMSFCDLRTDRPSLNSRWDVLLGVVADFSMTIDGRLFLCEEMFPIVELAWALRRWLDASVHEPDTEFVYSSLESSERFLLRFTPRDGGWAVGSPLQEHGEVRLLSTEEVRTAAERFVQDVRTTMKARLNVDVDRLLGSC